MKPEVTVHACRTELLEAIATEARDSKLLLESVAADLSSIPLAGLVILISSSRFLLLKTWSDFAESSEASNQLVLTSLEPLDYAFVAFLPGISEELLFRGALLPLIGINLTSATAVAALFGILHLGSGRKFSFK
nr:zinc finger, RING/FYVE/PHD-type [Tanacetum cinerariifolium]